MMNTIKFTGKFENINSTQLVAILGTILDPNKLKYRMGPIDEEIDYEDALVEIHFVAGNKANKFLMTGETNETIEGAKRYFDVWVKLFSNSGVRCSIELYRENEVGEEIENVEIKSTN